MLGRQIQQIYDNLTDVYTLLYALSRTGELGFDREFGDDIALSASRMSQQYLISLCALTRNIAECTDNNAKTREINIRLLGVNSSTRNTTPVYTRDSINLYQATSRVLHSTTLYTITNTAYLGKLPKDPLEAYNYVASSREIDMAIICKTEKDGLSMFYLKDLLMSVYKLVGDVMETADMSVLTPRNFRDI